MPHKVRSFVRAFIFMGRPPPEDGEDLYGYCRLTYKKSSKYTPTAAETAEANRKEDAKAAAKEAERKAKEEAERKAKEDAKAAKDAERKRKEETKAAAKDAERKRKEETKAAAKATKEATKAAAKDAERKRKEETEAAAKATKEATKAAAKAAAKEAEAKLSPEVKLKIKADKAETKIYLPAGTTCACGKKLEKKVTVGVKLMNNKYPTMTFWCPHQKSGRVCVVTTAADRAKVLQTVPNNGGAHLEEALMTRLRLIVDCHNQAGKPKDDAAFTDVVIRDDIITAEGNKGRPRGTKNVQGTPNGGALVRLVLNGKRYQRTFKTMEEAVEWRDATLREVSEKRRRRI